MFVIRDLMYCKPGKVRPLVEKFNALAKLGETMGFGAMRVMTDISGERFWTVVSELEVSSLEQHMELTRKAMGIKEFQDIMQGYHDLVEGGRREIYMLEK